MPEPDPPPADAHQPPVAPDNLLATDQPAATEGDLTPTKKTGTKLDHFSRLTASDRMLVDLMQSHPMDLHPTLAQMARKNPLEWFRYRLGTDPITLIRRKKRGP